MKPSWQYFCFGGLVTLLLFFAVVVLICEIIRDLDCSDFKTQPGAQKQLEKNFKDPHHLDADGNGIACESNPKL